MSCAIDAAHDARLGQESRPQLASARAVNRGSVAAQGHPRVLLAEPLHLPDHVQPPGPFGPGLVAERLEGNRQLDRVTRGGEATLGLKHEIEGEVGLPTLDEEAVLLDTQRVDHRHVRPPTVVECVEVDRDMVLVRDAVAACESGTNERGDVVRHDGQMQGSGCVADPHPGRVARLGVLLGVSLTEAIKARGLRPRLVLDGAVEERAPRGEVESPWVWQGRPAAGEQEAVIPSKPL